jgi:hypothetical protein
MGAVVSTSFTLPPVSLPVRLCSVSSTITDIPGMISALRVPSIAEYNLNENGFCQIIKGTIIKNFPQEDYVKL